MTSQPQPSGSDEQLAGSELPCMKWGPGCAMFALRTRSCEIQAPAESPDCWTLNAPQKPPARFHCMPGPGPCATAE